MVKKRAAGPSLPGPANIWGSGQFPGGRGDLANIETSPQPRRATEGSAGLDLHSTTRLVLTPQMGTQVIETDFKGPLQKDTVGLLFGRSSSALRGLIVHPGVIDPDYQGVVKVMVSSPRGIVSISPGDRVAQIVLLPSLHGLFPSAGKQRGKGGFGASGVDLTCLSLQMDQRPVLELRVDGKAILGLLDTGADRSIIAQKDWPQGWPVQNSNQMLRGLGYAKAPDMSARSLKWKDAEGHSGEIQPYVLELPISLWGRDLLKDLGLRLTNESSPTSRHLMQDMGWHPSYGLGKYLQGRKSPIIQKKKMNTEGLGFS